MKKILVLDDELDMDFIFKTMLEDEIEHEQLSVDYFSNPRDCLNALTKTSAPKYDFIFSDINMPQINGVQFVKELRQNGYQGSIAFISAYLKDDYEEAMKQFNVSIFFPKPLNFNEIRDLLEL
jgi:CheY-like chemotaxis protein